MLLMLMLLLLLLMLLMLLLFYGGMLEDVTNRSFVEVLIFVCL